MCIRVIGDSKDRSEKLNHRKPIMKNLEKISDDIVVQAENSHYGFGTSNLSYYVNQSIQSGAASESDFDAILSLSKRKAQKVCPARSIESFKKYSKAKGIELNFRSLVYLDSEAGKKPKYDLSVGDSIADVIIEVFSGYKEFDRPSLLDEMKNARLKQVIESQIKMVKESDY